MFFLTVTLKKHQYKKASLGVSDHTQALIRNLPRYPPMQKNITTI
jgi:hypothetical protein